MRRRRQRTDELRRQVDAVPFWFHSIDLGGGVVTPGVKSPEHLAAELDRLRLPSVQNQTVLDIGAWDGYFSFEAERRGARRVVALDHYVWSLDFRERDRHAGPLPMERECFRSSDAVWRPDALPGKRGFDVAREALGSSVEPVVADFATMDVSELGTFDVVLFLGVLYHLWDPLGALVRLREVTSGVAVVETEAIAVGGLGGRALAEFYPRNELGGDASNWWAPTMEALQGWCETAGFARVEPQVDVPSPEPGEVTHYRAVVHAHP